MNVKLEGMITIGRSGGSHGDTISVEIHDDASGCVIARAEIGMTEFAEVITGLARTKCTVRWTNIDRIGKVREVKTEFVPLADKPFEYEGRYEEASQQAKPFEIDGWKMSSGDYGNHHRATEREGVRGYLCAFVRFMDQPK